MNKNPHTSMINSGIRVAREKAYQGNVSRGLMEA
jgi:hypothetical protein